MYCVKQSCAVVQCRSYIRTEDRSEVSTQSLLIKPSVFQRNPCLIQHMRKRCNPAKRVTLHCAASGRDQMKKPSHGYDYYELLGVDPSCSFKEMKTSYRWLQKRCHPDIAGNVGHDMSLLLNEAYSVLSDESMRSTYDQLRVSWIEESLFPREPLWSHWMGNPKEPNAVFVDEVACIGCLKCAMIAGETFAIESKWGRARAVWQWGNNEDTVQDAIEACPVDCIRWVERSKLPVLEHLMSKFPRVHVGVSQHSDGVKQQWNVFQEAELMIEKRRRKMEEEESRVGSEDFEKSRVAAETIRTKSGRWWHAATSGGNDAMWRSLQKTQGALVPYDWLASPEQVKEAKSKKFSGFQLNPDLHTLHEAARKKTKKVKAPENVFVWGDDSEDEEYWEPLERISCAVNFYRNQPHGQESPVEITQTIHAMASTTEVEPVERFYDKLLTGIPMMMSAAAVMYVTFTAGDSVAESATDVSSPLPEQFISGLGAQVVFAGVVWYAIGSILAGLVALMHLLLVGNASTAHIAGKED